MTTEAIAADVADDLVSASDRSLLEGARFLCGGLAAMAALAALVLLGTPAHTAETFAWTVADPLTAAVLGAAFASGSVLLGFASASERWADARLTLGTVVVLTSLVACVTWTGHLEGNGDTGYPMLVGGAWAWLNALVPVVVLSAMAGYVADKVPVGVRRQELPLLATVLLVPLAMVAVAVGALLLLEPADHADWIPWRTVEDETQLLGAVVMTVGVAMLMAIGERDAARLRGPSCAAVVLGGLLELIAVVHGAQLAWTSPDGLGYHAAALALLGLGSAGLALRFALPDENRWAAQVRGAAGPRRGAGRVTAMADQGLFGPDSVAWRVWLYPTGLVLGFQRAVVVEELDPFLLASVDATQKIRTDARARFDHTIRYFGTIAFADTRTVVKSSQALMRIHAKNTGIEPISGERFDANDPDSQLWILLTGWHSVLKAYEMYGPGRLSPEDESRYWEECAVAAELQTCDPDQVPRTREGVRDYYQAVRPRLRTSPAAIDTMDYLLGARAIFPKLPFFLLPAAWAVNRALRAAVIATLPAWQRQATGLDQPKLLDRAVTPIMRLAFGIAARLPWLEMRILKVISPTTPQIAAPALYSVRAKERRTYTPAEAFARHDVPTPAALLARIKERPAQEND